MRYFAMAMASLAGGLLGSAALAQNTGVFGSFVGITSNANFTWYQTQNGGANQLASFNGRNLGTYTYGTNSLLLGGGELETFKNSGGNVTGAEIFFRVYLQGSTPGSFTSLSLGFTSNIQFNDAAGNAFNNPGDQKWAQIPGTPDLLALTNNVNGTYNLEVYFRATTNAGDRFSNNGGSNFIATFTTVPAPSAAAGLLALGGLAMRRRR